MKKNVIRNCGINGLRLEGRDVARVSRNRGRVTLRHSWDNEDGRAASAVMAAARSLAASLARETQRSVDVVDSNGDLVDVIFVDG